LLKLKGKALPSRPCQPKSNTEPWPITGRFQSRRQDRAGAGGAAGTHQPAQPVFDHQWCDRWTLDQLVPIRIGILHLQHGAAAAAGIRVVAPSPRSPARSTAAPGLRRDSPADRRACGHCPCAVPVARIPKRFRAAVAWAHHWSEAWKSCASCGRSSPAGWPLRWPGR
jgi:hypothetical protein